MLNNIHNALLIYPSQMYCADPDTAPIVIKTQMVKLFSYLKNCGIDVCVLDLELEYGRPRNAEECKHFLNLASKNIGKKKYDFIGISCYTSLSYVSTLEISTLCKRLHPLAKIAVGGYHCLGDVNDFSDHGDIDYIVQGCGINFLDDLLSGQPLPRICSYKEYSPNPNPMRYTEYPYRYSHNPSIANIQLSQGCPFRCNFCSEPFVGNSQYRPLDVEVALANLDEVIQDMKPAKVVINDVAFGLNSRWCSQFLNALYDRHYEQIFWVEMRVDTITEQKLALLSKMNFDVTVGLESLSVSTLRNMQKTSHPHRYIRAFFDSTKLFQRYDIPNTYTIMLNFPGESWTSFCETMDNIELAQQLTPNSNSMFDFLEYSFYPGNNIYSKIEVFNAQHGTEIGDRKWYNCRNGTMLEMALCTVPSMNLLKRVGQENMRTYFCKKVAHIQERTKKKENRRSMLIRSWRFVEALKKRLPTLCGINFYASDLSSSAMYLSKQIAAMAAIHSELSICFRIILEDSNNPSWWDRDRAWNLAVDFIAQRLNNDQSKINEKTLETLSSECAKAVRKPELFLSNIL